MIFLFFQIIHMTSSLKENLAKYLQLKDLGQAKQILGMKILINKEQNSVTLDQRKWGINGVC